MIHKIKPVIHLYEKLGFQIYGEQPNSMKYKDGTYAGFGSLKGMQITGRAQIVPPFSDVYLKVLEYKKIPAEALKKLNHAMYLIQVTPERIDFLNSDFKKNGFDSRQFVEF